jgi:hypothetical protein
MGRIKRSPKRATDFTTSRPSRSGRQPVRAATRDRAAAGAAGDGYKGSPLFVFDLMEPRRAKVDALVRDLHYQIRSAADFVLRSDGVVRLAPQLARCARFLIVRPHSGADSFPKVTQARRSSGGKGLIKQHVRHRPAGTAASALLQQIMREYRPMAGPFVNNWQNELIRTPKQQYPQVSPKDIVISWLLSDHRAPSRIKTM